MVVYFLFLSENYLIIIVWSLITDFAFSSASHYNLVNFPIFFSYIFINHILLSWQGLIRIHGDAASDWIFYC